MDSPHQKLEAIAQSRSAPDTELEAQGVAEIVGNDLSAMLSFYRALGFRVERLTGPFAVVNGFGMRIFLAESADAPTYNRWANLRIIVPDVDLVWACVSAIGLPIVHAVTDRPWGLRDFVVGDPSGFEIRFAQVL
jgi:catechol 2,3-dioxygenase-like lactoylglutathione lyase family enzyme